MTTTIYKEEDADSTVLEGKTVAILGYGNQGRAQALNLRDSGVKVLVGNREDDYRKLATNDAFPTFSIPKAVKQADIVFVLLPDEIVPKIFEKEIKPNLKEHACLVCAHGYAITFETISPPENIDILLIAPRMIGRGVRESYLKNEGFYSFVTVHQDASGKAKAILLALCQALGTLQKGAIELSFKQEAILDLFNEQAFGPAFGRVLLSSIFTLINAGYPPEAVLIEMYLSGEMEYTYQKFREIGLVDQTNLHSNTSQYGAMSRAMKFMGLPIGKIQKKILKDIENGEFAREWEKPLTKLKFRFLKFFATKTKIKRVEKKVRKNLNLPTFDFSEEVQLPDHDEKDLEKIKEELEEFKEFYKEF